MRISDWSSDVCSSDLARPLRPGGLSVRSRALRRAALAPVDPVKIEAAVGEVAHGPFGSGPGEVGKVHVGDGQSLDILACLRRDAVARKGKVAGRQDARLGILNVHILDAGQIADIEIGRAKV